MSVNLRKNIALFIFITITGQLFSQYSEEYLHYKALYPDVDRVCLNIQTNVNIELHNNEIEITLTNHEEDLFLSPMASHYSERSVFYSTFYELVDIKASSYLFQKNKYKQLKVKDFKYKDDISGSAFYDDTKSISFIYSNLQEGAKTVLSYEEVIVDPHFLNIFYFGSFSPVINATYVITVDKRISLTFKEFNADTLNLNFSKEEQNGDVIYTWVVKNIPEYEDEDNSINFRSSVPHVVPYITSYTVKGKKIDLLNDVGGLYGWYYQLTKDINQDETHKELVSVVNSLIVDKETEIDKVRAIYYWVQQNIKYVAFEYALGGFVPRNANDIFIKKYGDCKDNSSIMQEMFKVAGITGNLTWVGTRDIPYTYNDIPTPAVDNHMILAYINDTVTYFLDATSRFLPLGMPSFFIQEKEALIAIDSNTYIIEKIPVVDAEDNYLTDSVHLSINDRALLGKGNARMGGYTKISYYDVLERWETMDDLKRVYNNNFRKGNNKFLIDEFKETNKYDYEKDFIVDYSFKIDNYVLTAGDEIYVNLNLVQRMNDFKIKEEDKLDKEFKYKNINRYIYTLTIPKGYHVEYLPPDVTLENEKYATHIAYTNNGSQVIYEHDIWTNFLILRQDEFEGFNDFIEQLDKAYKESVVIKKDNN